MVQGKDIMHCPAKCAALAEEAESRIPQNKTPKQNAKNNKKMLFEIRRGQDFIFCVALFLFISILYSIINCLLFALICSNCSILMESWRDEYICEEFLESFYNETSEESDLILRNMIDFTIIEAEEHPESFISLEYLDKGDTIQTSTSNHHPGKGVLLGTVIEPLSSDRINCLQTTLCTYQNPKENLPFDEIYEQNMQAIEQSIANFDQSTLKVGDSVDGYCPRTLAWYPSVIVDEDISVQKVKLHFKGWKPKFDEWVDKTGDRINVSNYSIYHVYKLRKTQGSYIPYYDQDKLTHYISNESTHMMMNTNTKQCKALIYIEDWCIDYTYANPSLWIISTNNIWYRIAGAFCGSFLGIPSIQYTNIYQSISEKYFYSTCLAMCLFDILPTFPKSSYETVVKEAQMRSENLINESFILTHYLFFIEQLSALETVSNTNQPISFKKSLFMSQLKLEGIKFNADKITVKKRKSSVAFAERSGGDNTANNGNTEELNDTILLNTMLGHKTLNKKIKFPIDDKIFWDFQRTKSIKIPALPPPILSKQLTMSKDLQTWTLSVWSILVNCSSLLDIPVLDIFEFETYLRSEGGLHPMVRSIIIELLVFMIKERVHKKNSLCVRTNYELLDEETNAQDTSPICSLIDIFTTASSSTLSPDVSGGSLSGQQDHIERLSSYLNTGDVWVEVLRILIAEKNDLVLPQYHDAIGECECIIKKLLSEIDVMYVKLNKKVKENQERQQELARLSIGLSTILTAIQEGKYSESSVMHNSDSVGSAAPVSEYRRDQRVDVWSVYYMRWIEAVFLSSDAPHKEAIIHYDDVSADIDAKERVPLHFITPLHSHSGDKFLCTTPPAVVAAAASSDTLVNITTIPPVNTRRQGHEGVAVDIEALFDAAPDLSDTNLTQLLDTYRDMYSTRVLKVVEHPTLCKAPGADDTVVTENFVKGLDFIRGADGEVDCWVRVVTLLSTKEIHELQLEVKIRMLFWACDALLSTHAAKTFLENAMETVTRLDRESKARAAEGGSAAAAITTSSSSSTADMLDDEEEEAEEAVPESLTFSRSGRRLAPVVMEPRADVKKARPVSAPSPTLTKQQQSSEGREGMDEGTTDTTAGLGHVTVSPTIEESVLQRPRQEPLGGDREGNLYWLFFDECKHLRSQLYCQRAPTAAGKPSEWVLFSSGKDVDALLAWLSEKCRGEAGLKRSISQWRAGKSTLDDHTSTSLPPSSEVITDGLSTSAVEVGVSLSAPTSSAPDTAATSTISSAISETAADVVAIKEYMKQLAKSSVISPLLRGDGASALCIRLGVDSPADLGFSMQVEREFVYVASIKQDSAASRAGLRVGDLLTAVDSATVLSPETVRNKAEDAAARRQLTGKACVLLVLRYREATMSELLMRALAKDPEFRYAYSAQHVSFLGAVDTVGQQDTVAAEFGRVPSGLIGALLDLLVCTASPYAVPHSWSDSPLKRYPAKVNEFAAQLASLRGSGGYSDSHKALVDAFVCALTSLESLLVMRGTALAESWTDTVQRTRYKWRLNCSRCKTYAQVSVCLLALKSYILWDALMDLDRPMVSQSEWLKLVVPTARSPAFPAFFGPAVYYAEGHFAYRNAQSPMWGETLIPREGNCAAQLFNTALINCLSCGPVKRPESCFPFMQVSLSPCVGAAAAPLKTLDDTLPLPLSVGMNSGTLEGGRLTRRLAKIVGNLIAAPDLGAFVHLVSAEEFPDYYTEVSAPICLQDIEGKIETYGTPEELRADIMRLHANCRLYCEGKFPDLILIADRLVAFFERMVARIEGSNTETTSTVVNGVAAIEDNGRGVKGVVMTGGMGEEETKEEIPLRDSPLADGGPGMRWTVCLQLKNDRPLFLINKQKYEAALDVVSTVEVETRFKAKVFDSGTYRTRMGVVIGHKFPLFRHGFLVWNSLKVEWLDAPREVAYVNPWDIELIAPPKAKPARGRGRGNR